MPPDEPDEPDKPKKKADEDEAAKKAAAIARYAENMIGLEYHKFENESDGEEESPASTVDQEVEAIDDLVEGKDEKFDKLKY